MLSAKVDDLTEQTFIVPRDNSQSFQVTGARGFHMKAAFGVFESKEYIETLSDPE